MSTGDIENTGFSEFIQNDPVRMDNKGIKFILEGLKSNDEAEIQNALQCVKFIRGLTFKNVQCLREAVECLKKHEKQHIKKTAINILRRISFNCKGSLTFGGNGYI